MKQRIITALILAPLVILGIFQLPLTAFIIALAVITGIGFWEWTQFVGSSSRIRSLLPGVMFMALLGVSAYPQLTLTHTITSFHQSLLCVAFLWWIWVSYIAMTFPISSGCWKDKSYLKHLFGLLTLLPFFWSMVLLRSEGIEQDFYHGAKLVLFVCLIVWTADSAAYFSGRFFGKRKMAPAVSPNKTIEGLIGGVIASLVVAFVVANWFEIHFANYPIMAVTILLTVVFSVLGDLVESMFKRVADIKDSSHIIPGHGGVLDRVDSLTAAFPVFAFLYFIFN